jgi:hypothetical protein
MDENGGLLGSLYLGESYFFSSRLLKELLRLRSRGGRRDFLRVDGADV